MLRSMDRKGATPVPPATNRRGRSSSRKKKVPWGALSCTASPTFAPASHCENAPPGTLRMKNSSRFTPGAFAME
jgi:hypothetical protein